MRPSWLPLVAALLAGCATIPRHGPAAEDNGRPSLRANPREVRALMALDPAAVTDRQAQEVLARFPAPRVILFNGVVAPVRMDRMAEFFIARGYPRASFVDPVSGRMSHSSRTGSRQWAGALPWYFEQEGLRPVLIGHSQGGMMVSRILHEGAGTFGPGLRIYNPRERRFEERRRFRHPRTGRMVDVAAYRTPLASAIATGKMMRVLLGQWKMVGPLRKVPDNVEVFIGVSVEGDLIGSDLAGAGSTHTYRPTGSARVENLVLPRTANHLNLPALTRDPGDPRSLLAGRLWRELKRAWCAELQAAHRGPAGR
ncbi:MAG: hypothetical protein HKN82_01990 [Akkermansiaceae bacterium]|nr:hypothetical protein [Akkermansiaceae bacterium]